MKSPYVTELQPNQNVNGTFLVSYKEVRQKKSGEPYLSLTLTDRTGDVDAKMWDNAADVIDTFKRDDFLRIKGLLQVFQNRPQLTLHKLQPVPESEVDLADYLPASKRDRDEMFRELLGLIAGMSDPHIKTLLEDVFSDEQVARAFRTAPAAKTVHHAWIGGLLEHVLSLAQLAKITAAHYADIDLDLLLAGVILHDLGKITELHYARSFGYTDQGQLLGHIVIGFQMLSAKMRPDFPPRLRDLLMHMILSHHGQMDYGSPKVPMFPEAMLLHQLDTMDSKMECMRSLIERDRLVEGAWTGYSSTLERSVLKKRKFLNPPVTPESPAPANASQQPKPPHRQAGADSAASLFADKLRGALTPDS